MYRRKYDNKNGTTFSLPCQYRPGPGNFLLGLDTERQMAIIYIGKLYCEMPERSQRKMWYYDDK